MCPENQNPRPWRIFIRGDKVLKIAIVDLITLTTVPSNTAISFVGLLPKGRPYKESELNIVELAEAISRIGNDVTVYVSDAYLPEIPSKPKPHLHVEYLPTHLKWIFSPGMIPFTPALFHRIRKGHYDIVLSTDLFQWGTFISALAGIGRNESHVLVWQEADVYSFSAINRLVQWFFYHTFGKLVVSLVDGFVSRTTVAEEFLMTLGIPHSKLLGVIPSGVNTDVFRPLNDGDALRRKLHIKSTNRVVTCVTTLYHDRGLDLLIRAMREVVNEIPEAKLLIRGRGPLKATLDAIINNLGLERSVSIIGDYFTREELCALLNISDVVVVIFRWYGFLPFTALESIACGKPVISASERRLRGLKDFIKDDTTGFLVEYEVEDISQKIKFMVKNPARSKEMGHNALELCRRTCDMRLVAERFVDLFRRLVS